MNEDKKREQTIQNIVALMRTTQFSVEFKVMKKPAGIKVICEVTQEQMDMLTEKIMQRCNKCVKV